MPKRTTAALLALLVAASTLAVVTASPAAAHPQTTTKRYCSYDPFAGQQCWTQSVPVVHHHPPPRQTCPAGTTGTPPNCAPIPSDNSNHDNSKGGDKKTGGDGSGSKGTRSNRDTTTKPKDSSDKKTKDPCGDYAENLINALNKAAHTGTYNAPTTPDGCDGPSTADLIAKFKSLTEAEARRLLAALKVVQDAPDTANKAAAELGNEIEKLWDKTPAEAKAIIKDVAAGVGCAGLAVAIAKTTVATGGTAAPGWIAWVASPAGKTALGVTCGVAVSAARRYIERVNNGSGTDATNGNGQSGTKQPTPKKKVTADDVMKAGNEARADPNNPAKRKAANEMFRRYACQNNYKNVKCDGTE